MLEALLGFGLVVLENPDFKPIKKEHGSYCSPPRMLLGSLCKWTRSLGPSKLPVLHISTFSHTPTWRRLSLTLFLSSLPFPHKRFPPPGDWLVFLQRLATLLLLEQSPLVSEFCTFTLYPHAAAEPHSPATRSLLPERLRGGVTSSIVVWDLTWLYHPIPGPRVYFIFNFFKS